MERDESNRDEAETSGAPHLDDGLLGATSITGTLAVAGTDAALLASIAGLHQQVDLAIDEGDLDEAQGHAARLAELTTPPGTTTPALDLLRQDAAFRQDEVAFLQERHEQALAFAEAGLEVRPAAADLFVANLEVLRGQSLELLGRPVDAARAFHKALVINEGLLNNLLDEPSSRLGSQGGTGPAGSQAIRPRGGATMRRARARGDQQGLGVEQRRAEAVPHGLAIPADQNTERRVTSASRPTAMASVAMATTTTTMRAAPPATMEAAPSAPEEGSQ